MIKILLIIFLTITLNSPCSLAAGSIPRDFLKNYKKTFSSEKSSIPIINPGFKNGKKGWYLPDGYSIVPAGGRSGTACLKYQRTNPKNVRLASQVVRLVPGKKYKFSAWIRTDNIKGKEAGGTICMEFYKGGKYMRGSYPVGVVKDSEEWTQVVGETSVPKGASVCKFVLYLRPKMTGTIWFDDVKIGIASKNWEAWIPSGYEAVSNINSNIKISVYYDDGAVETNDLNNFKCFVEASKGNFYDSNLVDIKNGKASTVFPSLPVGNINLKASFINTKSKKIYYQKKFNINAIDKNLFAKRVKWFNNNGAIIVNKKLFLPVGIFTNPAEQHAGHFRKTLRTIADGGFNCVLPYHSAALRLDWNKSASKKSINETLDYCHELDLKVIFAIKDFYSRNCKWMGEKGSNNAVKSIIKNFKDHPAILAWYISDENPNNKEVAKRNRLVNKLDPAHPTYSVQYKYDIFPSFGETANILGVEPYPIKSNDSDSMEQVSYAMNQANKITGTPIWGVLQIFNWGPIKAKRLPESKKDELVKRFRDPTEEEMRSMALLMAIKGVKGFVFWQFDELYRPPLSQVDFDRQWPKVCRVARMLRKLAPFILSSIKPKNLALKTIKGSVIAKEFIDDQGDKRIIIAAIGPGKAKAILTLDGNEYGSVFGKTVKQKQNQYLFSAKNISSDILYIKK